MEIKRSSPMFYPVNYAVSPESKEIQKHNWGVINLLSEKCVSPMYLRLSAAFIYPEMHQPEHEHPGEDELLYIISGKGNYYVCNNKFKVSAKNLVYIPAGIPHYTDNDGWEPLRYLSIKYPLNNEIDQELKKKLDKQINYVIPSEEIPVEDYSWGAQKSVNNLDEPPLNMKVEIFYLLPKMKQQLYCHDSEVELVYVLSGKGAYMINGDEYKIEGGMLMYIPAKEEHYAINRGWESLKLITVKVPAV